VEAQTIESGLRLRDARISRRLTQEEVADRLALLSMESDGKSVPVNAEMISKWERGHRKPRLSYRRLLCTLFQSSEEDLALGFGRNPDIINRGSESEDGMGYNDVIVDREVAIVIRIDDEGHSQVRYRYDIFNGGTTPITKIRRELWFENIWSDLTVRPADCDRSLMVERIKETPSKNVAKFVVHMSPALQPGDNGSIEYVCDGGAFIEDHYWSQEIVRPTSVFDLSVHLGKKRLTSCMAMEVHPDGAERSVPLEFSKSDEEQFA